MPKQPKLCRLKKVRKPKLSDHKFLFDNHGLVCRQNMWLYNNPSKLSQGESLKDDHFFVAHLRLLTAADYNATPDLTSNHRQGQNSALYFKDQISGLIYPIRLNVISSFFGEFSWGELAGVFHLYNRGRYWNSIKYVGSLLDKDKFIPPAGPDKTTVETEYYDESKQL